MNIIMLQHYICCGATNGISCNIISLSPFRNVKGIHNTESSSSILAICLQDDVYWYIHFAIVLTVISVHVNRYQSMAAVSEFKVA